MRPTITPKQFQKLMGEYTDHPTDFDAYADAIGWPWRATQEQLDYWNAWMRAAR